MGLARVEWQDGRAQLSEVIVGADDDDLLEAMQEAAKAGIHCPLGWPIKFIEFITRHHADHVAITPDVDAARWRKEPCYRVTDLHVKSMLSSIQGLSVSTDRIGVTTMRCAALLSMLAERRAPVDRSGRGIVVEVYPAGRS